MYKNLLASGRIANLAEPDGHCGDRIQAYYEARARGGAATKRKYRCRSVR